MTSLSFRALRPAGLLLGLLSACAPLSRTTRRETPDTIRTALPTNTPLTSEDIARVPGQPIEMVLAGRFPGVDVFSTPGGISVRIRGASSFHGSSEPLYVVDGMPMQPGPHGTLSGINPYDIATIEVVKDAAGTAMWGVRGANGVIVIKTKRSGH